ncbi:MAG: PA2779 family protein [Nitrospirae bacterium]|nr:PA2779 family protein [Nitrospirota bacterium]NTW65048.1 PA2779 family protein [Nitrospirota bacterium]
MKHMLKAFYTRPLVIYLVLALLAISTAAGPAEAMLLPISPGAAPGAPAHDRAADLATVQKTLESKELRQKLLDYGLTPEETEARIAALSDEQLHQLAANLDSVQAGGDSVLGVLLGLVIIALLVVLIIYLLEGRIEIKKK